MAHLQREDDPGTAHELRPPTIRIGRADNNDVTLEGDMRVSRHHARVDLHGDQWVITDLQSTNGTAVNGQRITSHALRPGDRVQLGAAVLVFVSVDDGLATVADPGRSPDGRGDRLSEREREILALVGLGRTDREIGRELFISVATVRSHLDRIRDKTGRRRRPELTRLALELEQH
jgi:pSer/pThr/pTyr-binding forkhead associated (FHA) protein